MRYISPALVVAGGVLFITSTFLTYFTYSDPDSYDTSNTFWEASIRMDIILVVFAAAVIVLSIVSELTRARWVVTPALVLSGFILGAYFFWDSPDFDSVGVGGWLGALGGVLMVAGTVLASLLSGDEKSQPRSISTGQPRGPAALPPQGWYPDPGGTGAMRHWDGVQWGDLQPPPPA